MQLALLLAPAAAARAWLLFSTPWVPGMNGGYYLVQARALLQHGALGLPDLPLLFHLHAGLAWALAAATGQPLEAAIVLAVKLADSLLPPLAALPVYLLARRWEEHLGRHRGLSLVAAALACLSFPLLIMVGDLQKNALALVWLAGLIAALHHWLGRPSRRRGAACLGWLALLGLTHIGVLGSALVLTGAVMALSLTLSGGARRDWLPWALAGALVLALAAGLVWWQFDPARIHRLAAALAHPAAFATDEGRSMPPGAGPPPMMRWLPFGLFGLATAPALVLVWRQRQTLDHADAAVAAGCGLTALLLTGPWFSFDKTLRFQLIALIPALLAATFAALHLATAGRRRWAAGLALLLLVAPAAPSLWQGGQPILNEAALQELADLRPFVPDPEHTLVCTQHGAEWWAAWLLHTHIAQAPALKSADWTTFAQVLFLEVKGGIPIPGGSPPEPPGGTGAPGGMPSMPGVTIPEDANVLYEGATFRLARLLQPPAGLTPTTL